MLVRLLHKLKANCPMLVTLSGIVMLVRLVQNWKAPASILVTLSGIVMLVRLLQKAKASSPMLVTLSGIAMLVRLSHSRKASPPILVTLSGIVMLIRLLHRKKAPPPMLVTGLPLMAFGMTSSPDTSLSQPVIVTASPCISYFKTEELWLHPPRSRGSDIDNKSARLIMKTMSAARRRGHYKTLTRLHRHQHHAAGTKVRCTR